MKYNIYLKVGSIAVIFLLLLIPSSMNKDFLNQRKLTRINAVEEVSSKWSKAQTISGPFIAIPYYKYLKDPKENTIQVKDHIYLMPAELNITSVINPEKRTRGIYEVVVYETMLDISGGFDMSILTSLNIPLKDIAFGEAEFVLGIDDVRGIEKSIDLTWNSMQIPFKSGVSSRDVVASGISVDLDLAANGQPLYKFRLNMDLRGSQRLYFTPMGKVTDVNVSSTWTDPSFNGAFLPDSKKISNKGFEANWDILHLNRGYPQAWAGSTHTVGESSFGVDLLLPVDNYQKIYRTIQYSVMFIGFTFVVFFFVEIINKVFIHPVQYILVGTTLVVFYTLLLSISEYLKYNAAFLISALVTLLLIVGYVKAILKSNKLVLLISGILGFLYFFVYTIIQLKNYAFLIGSIGVFAILALVMYFSRKIDWYNLNFNNENPQKP